MVLVFISGSIETQQEIESRKRDPQKRYFAEIVVSRAESQGGIH